MGELVGFGKEGAEKVAVACYPKFPRSQAPPIPHRAVCRGRRLPPYGSLYHVPIGLEQLRSSDRIQW
jgi:hypothetical protein